MGGGRGKRKEPIRREGPSSPKLASSPNHIIAASALKPYLDDSIVPYKMLMRLSHKY